MDMMGATVTAARARPQQAVEQASLAGITVAVMGAEPLVTADALLPLRLQMPILSCSLTMLSTSSLPQPGMKQGKRNCSGKGALSWLARRACVLIWIGR